jgi:hypothetical protein
MAMAVDDSGIHIAREPEIIGVYNQKFHWMENRDSNKFPLFLPPVPQHDVAKKGKFVTVPVFLRRLPT